MIVKVVVMTATGTIGGSKARVVVIVRSVGNGNTRQDQNTFSSTPTPTEIIGVVEMMMMRMVMAIHTIQNVGVRGWFGIGIGCLVLFGTGS